jgi:hypothetical protein
MFYNNIFCIIIVITLIIAILYKKYYTENFLVIKDSQLYSNPNENNTPLIIKTKIPSPVNQLNSNELSQIDDSILRNNRISQIFSLNDELDIYQMYNILKQLKNNKYNFNYNIDNNLNKSPTIINSDLLNNINSGAIKNVDLNLFTRIKLEIISSFNNFIINSGYYVSYHPYQFFKIINSNLISFNKNYKKDNNNIIDNYCFTLTFGREFKYQQFVIYYDIDLIKNPTQTNPTQTNPTQTNPTQTNPTQTNPTQTNYTIILNKVEITGLPVPNTIEFHKNNKIEKTSTNNINQALNTKEIDNINNESNYYTIDQVSDTSLFDVSPSEESSKLFQRQNLKFVDNNERSDMDLTLFDKNSITTKIDEKIMNISKDQQFNNHKCFGLVNGVNQELPEYKNPIFCKSYHPEINQNGIWDAPCQVDNDCPFYKANKNYSNEYGKCDKITGTCEMPLGVIPLGFTKYGKIEPNCYNCKISSKDSKCCNTQINDIYNGNVKYKSPDYIFNNDESTRKKFENELNSLGLKVNPSI